jgi:solute carrier family 7 (L-type amino acid transporter), member 9/15
MKPPNAWLQTAISRLLGSACGIVAAVLICFVVAGSLLGNSFVAGRMAVAASNKTWLPQALGFLGHVGFKAPTADPAPSLETADDASSDSDSPMNALILSTGLSALYVLFGNFRALLTFNGLGEYTFFFLVVVGAIVLRVREPALPRPYKPIILIPVVFAVVSGFVVARGAAFAPFQAIFLVVLWLVGLVYYMIRKRWLARHGE